MSGDDEETEAVKPTEEVADDLPIPKNANVNLSLEEYLVLRQKANSQVNWPAIITALAGLIGTVVSAVALLLNQGGATP